MAGVSFRDVRKSYGATEIIHGVTTDVADGEFVVIVGPSGCGKSTLLRMVAGLERITSGEIAIGARVVNELEPKDRDIAMVFQNYALYPHMSVRENMAYGLKIRRMASADIEARVQAGGGDPRARPVPRPQAARAFRRPAPARGDGPRDRPRAGGVPVRRAAVEPGREAARADARRAAGAAPAAGHDQPLRHARPGRGDDARAPDDRDERRPRRADRRAARGLRETGHDLRRRFHRLAADEPDSVKARRARRPAGRAAGAPRALRGVRGELHRRGRSGRAAGRRHAGARQGGRRADHRPPARGAEHRPGPACRCASSRRTGTISTPRPARAWTPSAQGTDPISRRKMGSVPCSRPPGRGPR